MKKYNWAFKILLLCPNDSWFHNFFIGYFVFLNPIRKAPLFFENEFIYYGAFSILRYISLYRPNIKK